MVRWSLRAGMSVTLGLSLLVSSCGWLDRAAGNPKHEAHYMEAENLRRTAQHAAARDAYHKALEVNPANYFAHQELGDLYFQKFNDPGMGLYHYRRYLEIGQRVNGRAFTDPTAETGIQGCEFKLAERAVGQLARQRTAVEVEQFKRENESLRQQLAEAQRQLQLRALENRTPTLPNNPAAGNNGQVPPPPIVTPPTNRMAPRQDPVVRQDPPRPRETPPAATRTYVVRMGDTPASIARAHKVRIEALMAANPGLNPRRLRVGQTLNIPPAR